MQPIKYFIFFSVIVLCFSSCENFFETSLELDPPPFEKKLVLIASLKTGTEVFQVFVTENFGILDDEQIPTLKDPKIEFTINGQLYDNYVRTKLEKGYLFTFDLSNVELLSGDVCRMMVLHEGFPIATSTQVVPPNVALTNIKYVENGGLDLTGSERSKVNITLTDPKGQNFYEAYIKINNPNYNFPTYTSINEPGAAESVNGYAVIFNDISFEDSIKKISLLIYRASESEARNNKISIFWSSITEEYYKYARTAKVYYDSEENPFATPADVYSNVDGGLGIFYIINETEYPIF
jgi:hypothetical protein